jgi:hypothetical protein
MCDKAGRSVTGRTLKLIELRANMNLFYVLYIHAGPSGRGLRCRSTAAHLLQSWVRIPPGHGSLSVVCVVYCQVEVSATS